MTFESCELGESGNENKKKLKKKAHFILKNIGLSVTKNGAKQI